MNGRGRPQVYHQEMHSPVSIPLHDFNSLARGRWSNIKQSKRSNQWDEWAAGDKIESQLDPIIILESLTFSLVTMVSPDGGARIAR
jgi:hypothetical protein